jgi:hypothetical protein
MIGKVGLVARRTAATGAAALMTLCCALGAATAGATIGGKYTGRTSQSRAINVYVKSNRITRVSALLRGTCTSPAGVKRTRYFPTPAGGVDIGSRGRFGAQGGGFQIQGVARSRSISGRLRYSQRTNTGSCSTPWISFTVRLAR